MVYYIGVGSNVGKRLDNIQKAILYLKGEKIVVTKSSGVYETSAVGGPKGQRNFFNLVIEIDTQLKPKKLLVLLKKIEQKVGRKKSSTHWDEREIDLDIICCEGETIKQRGLVIPHPRMHERYFVLKPLRELAPSWQHPILKKDVVELLSAVKKPFLWRKECEYA